MEKLNCANFPQGWTSHKQQAREILSRKTFSLAQNFSLKHIIIYDGNEIVNHFKFFNDEPQKVIANDGKKFVLN